MQVVWTVIMDAVPTGGKNGQQIVSAVAKQVKTYSKLLNAFSNTGRAEAALLVHMQVWPVAVISHPFECAALAEGWCLLLIVPMLIVHCSFMLKFQFVLQQNHIHKVIQHRYEWYGLLTGCLAPVHLE